MKRERLKLHRETLRLLDPARLRTIHGNRFVLGKPPQAGAPTRFVALSIFQPEICLALSEATGCPTIEILCLPTIVIAESN